MSASSTYNRRLQHFIEKVTLYPVSCEKLANGRSDIEWLDSVLSAGVQIVQLRDKVSSDRAIYEKAQIFRNKTSQAGVLLIINNRVDIALAVGADGVHLGNSDLPVHEIRKLAPEMVIGISANSQEQAASAEAQGASYYNIGPLFPTSTKEGLTSFLGIEAIGQFSALSTLPFTVMGGIKRQHIPELTSSGARRIAVVTAITQAADMADEARYWLNEIQTGDQPTP